MRSGRRKKYRQTVAVNTHLKNKGKEIEETVGEQDILGDSTPSQSFHEKHGNKPMIVTSGQHTEIEALVEQVENLDARLVTLKGILVHILIHNIYDRLVPHPSDIFENMSDANGNLIFKTMLTMMTGLFLYLNVGQGTYPELEEIEEGESIPREDDLQVKKLIKDLKEDVAREMDESALGLNSKGFLTMLIIYGSVMTTFTIGQLILASQNDSSDRIKEAFASAIYNFLPLLFLTLPAVKFMRQKTIKEENKNQRLKNIEILKKIVPDKFMLDDARVTRRKIIFQLKRFESITVKGMNKIILSLLDTLHIDGELINNELHIKKNDLILAFEANADFVAKMQHQIKEGIVARNEIIICHLQLKKLCTELLSREILSLCTDETGQMNVSCLLQVPHELASVVTVNNLESCFPTARITRMDDRILIVVNQRGNVDDLILQIKAANAEIKMASTFLLEENKSGRHSYSGIRGRLQELEKGEAKTIRAPVKNITPTQNVTPPVGYYHVKKPNAPGETYYVTSLFTPENVASYRKLNKYHEQIEKLQTKLNSNSLQFAERGRNAQGIIYFNDNPQQIKFYRRKRVILAPSEKGEKEQFTPAGKIKFCGKKGNVRFLFTEEKRADGTNLFVINGLVTNAHKSKKNN